MILSLSSVSVEIRTVAKSIRSLTGLRIKFVEAYCVDIDPKTKTIGCHSDAEQTVSRTDDVKIILSSLGHASGASSRVIKDSDVEMLSLSRVTSRFLI